MNLTKLGIAVAIFAVGIFVTKKYMNGPMCLSKTQMNGKVVIVTGANTGIGKETVEDLLLRGAKVYLACRSLSRAQDAINDIVKSRQVDSGLLHAMQLDLNSLDSVRTFANNFRQRESRLDVLINNAGVMFVPYGKTEDGFETTFGVNHLGHFLLTNLLADLLVSSAPSRVVTVSSGAHKRYPRIRFNDLMYSNPEEYSSFDAYSHSKLANILFSRELGKRLKGTGVTSYSLHPGVVRTELGRHLTFFKHESLVNILFWVTWPFVKEPVNGAQTSICCAVDETLAETTGKYYSDTYEKEPTEAAQNDEDAARLWDISLKLVKLSEHEIHPRLR